MATAEKQTATNEAQPGDTQDENVGVVVPEVAGAGEASFDEIRQQGQAEDAWWRDQLAAHTGEAMKIERINEDGESRLFMTLTKSSRPEHDWQLTNFREGSEPQSHFDIDGKEPKDWDMTEVMGRLPASTSRSHYKVTWSPLVAPKEEKSSTVTVAMIDHAKRVSILDVAQKNGINLVHDGGDYWSWDRHDSLKVNARKNQFIWNSRQLSGTSIDFMMKVVGAGNFRQAVTALNNPELKTTSPLSQEERQPFTYNIKNAAQFDKARDYLTIARGLNPLLIDQLHQRGFIQQDDHGNAIFVWSRNGERVGASIQGTTIDKEKNGPRGTYKQIAKNSESDYGFNFSVGHPKQLYVFEAPIDALSYLSLHPQIEDTMFFAMDGLKPATVTKALVYYHNRTGAAPERVGFGVDNDPAGHRFFDEMVQQHGFINVETGKTIPYGHFMVDDLAVPQDRLKTLQQTAAKAGVAWQPLAALDKAETNFSDEVGNGYGFKGGFTHSDGRGAGAAYGQRATQLAGLMKGLTDENGLNYQALFKRLDPQLDPVMREAMIGKVQAYVKQYDEKGPKPVRFVRKDWNDRLKQVQSESGFPERLIDRIYAKQDERTGLKITRAINRDGKEQLKAVNSFDASIGFFEADSPQEMAYLIKTYGYNAVDKEDEHRYQAAPQEAQEAAKQPAAPAKAAVQAAAAEMGR